MNSETISLIILTLSFLGLVIFTYRKIPTLVLLPQATIDPGSELFSKIKDRIKDAPWLRNFSPEVFLQKIISQVRVLSLRADHKTANWLKTLRQKTQKKKLEDDNYWQELKNSKNKK